MGLANMVNGTEAPHVSSYVCQEGYVSQGAPRPDGKFFKGINEKSLTQLPHANSLNCQSYDPHSLLNRIGNHLEKGR